MIGHLSASFFILLFSFPISITIITIESYLLKKIKERKSENKIIINKKLERLYFVSKVLLVIDIFAMAISYFMLVIEKGITQFDKTKFREWLNFIKLSILTIPVLIITIISVILQKNFEKNELKNSK